MILEAERIDELERDIALRLDAGLPELVAKMVDWRIVTESEATSILRGKITFKMER